MADRRARTSPRYRGYPRLVGETGGKDFVIAHPSADPAVLTTALVRGAFEYQGQKCSAASRAYIPRSVWNRMRDDLIGGIESLTMGDVSADLSLFMGAVIDNRAFAKHADAIGRARSRPGHQRADRRRHRRQHAATSSSPPCWSRPIPTDEIFTTEYFGPILGVHVFEDADYDAVLAQAADIAPYALTGSIIAQDRAAIAAGHRGAAVLGRQLLHQRQADRGRRRPAAVRRRPGQRHQRQGRLDLQPDPLGERADDQGAVRPADRLPLPAHGVTR